MLQFTSVWDYYVLALSALAGAAMGSFLYCMALRMVHGESMGGRSRCAACGHILSARDLIPVASFLALRGKCRYCGKSMSRSYLYAELLSAAVFVSAVLRFGISLVMLEMLLLSCVLLAISFADLMDFIIPDVFILSGIAIRAAFILLGGNVWQAALKALVGGLSISVPVLLIVLLMDKLLKKETMGGGDIKLLFMAGLYFDWKINLMGILFACVAGILFAYGSGKKKQPIPFGPSITGGIWIAALAGEPLLNWYLGLF